MTERHYDPELQGKILGVNRRYYPNEWGYVHADWDNASVEVLVVLVAGAIEDYAAYVGVGSPDFVKRHGNKISFEEACVHFPGGQLERDRYRD